MDGRWIRGCAAGVLVGMVGCTSPQVRSPAELLRDNEKYTKALKPAQAESEPIRKDRKLKPETLVKLGALKDQAAEDPERPQAERDAFRQQARQSYQRAIDQDPKYVRAYMAMAGSFLQSGDRESAQATFSKALSVNPQDAALWFDQGTLYARSKDWSAAVDSLTQATRLDPENKTYQKTLGFALARCGHFEDSYAVLQRCMSEHEARFTLARMYKHLQQPELCQQQLALALKANPEYGPARELLNELAPGQPVTTARFEEPAKPASSPKSAETPGVQPVLMGGGQAVPAAPVKIGFDGIAN